MTGQPRFILGLGAQKAGSTWAREYLSSDSKADFGPIKEYHVWDALHLAHAKHFDQRHRGRLRIQSEGILRKLLQKGPDILGTRAMLQRNPSGYFDFFSSLLERPGVELTGDITPSYAGLTPAVIAKIRDDFTVRDIRVMAIFLLRDPVSRCISAAQMDRRKKNTNEGVPIIGDLNESVLSYSLSVEARMRADYRRTVETIRTVFSEKDHYLGLYETMFIPYEIKRISDFTGVTYRPELAKRHVNFHTKTETVSDATRAELRRTLDETYRFCADALPATRDHWMPA